MYCPICRSKDTKVIDSRVSNEGMVIRRRRECIKCNYRFSTLEQVELLDIMVVKRDGARESYSRNKLERGILHSLAKRPYTQEKFDRMVSAIERDIQKKKKREITSADIGEIVMKHMRKFDKIAYIRFASIYRSFEDVRKFKSEIRSLEKRRKSVPISDRILTKSEIKKI
ncbi:MAG: transcriptional regulator NrdR [Candidatus Magasanikbacteria bacterium]